MSTTIASPPEIDADFQCQLVVQFDASTTEHYHRLLALEDSLFDPLEEIADVDGHDFGSGTFNLFLFTDAPEESLAKVQAAIARQGIALKMRAAYRERDGEKFTILCPSDLSEFRVI
jgi:hypothetical protein